MSTIFEKEFKKFSGWIAPGTSHHSVPREARCSLCRGELYPGDPYFALDDRAVCEDCLGRYARGYFSHRLRRVGAEISFETAGSERNKEHP